MFTGGHGSYDHVAPKATLRAIDLERKGVGMPPLVR